VKAQVGQVHSVVVSITGANVFCGGGPSDFLRINSLSVLNGSFFGRSGITEATTSFSKYTEAVLPNLLGEATVMISLSSPV